MLCAPITHPYISRPLFPITHTAHLVDFLGHLCWIAALSAVIYATAYRLVPADRIAPVMRRYVDRPCAVAASIMLVCITLSHSTRTRTHADFFDVPVDGWLRAYWLTYGVLVVYLLIYVARLLLVLRTDPRSRVSADLLLGGSVLGIVSVTTIVTLVTLPESAIGPLHAFHVWMWVAMSIPSSFAASAGVYRMLVRRPPPPMAADAPKR